VIAVAKHTTNFVLSFTGLIDLSAVYWILDAARSSIGIRSKSMWGLATVGGEGEIALDGTAHGTLTIDAASIKTKKGKLENHPRSADFFDVDKHPTFTFTADLVVPDGAHTVKVAGQLTVLGRTRPLTFTAYATAGTPTQDTLTGEIAIDRNDFGISWNKAGMIKDPTTVKITTHFTRGLSLPGQSLKAGSQRTQRHIAGSKVRQLGQPPPSSPRVVCLKFRQSFLFGSSMFDP
jgi:polyisoprenoid-binding protein YceI